VADRRNDGELAVLVFFLLQDCLQSVGLAVQAALHFEDFAKGALTDNFSGNVLA